MTTRPVRWSVHLACALVGFVAVGSVLRQIARNATAAPFWDQWSFVPLLLETWRGHLRWDLLVEQANEHRLVIPRLLWLAMAIPSRWDIRLELAANVVVAAAIAFVLARLARRTVAAVDWWTPPVVTALAAAFVFSIACYENWLWGWQVQIFLTVWLAAWIALRLARWDGSDRGVAAMLVTTVLAPFTFASGLVLLGLLPIALLLGGAPPGRWRRAAIAGACGAATGALYFHGFAYPAQHPSPWLLLRRPGEFLGYLLAYVGGPLGGLRETAAITWGGVGVGLVAAAGGWAWWTAPALRRALLPWLFLAAYVAGNGAMTAVGRMGFGVAQAYSSRYLTISGLFWVALPAVLLLAWSQLRDPTRRAFAAGVLCASAPWLAHGYLDTTAASRDAIRQYADRFTASRACLVRPADAPEKCMGRIGPAPGVTRSLAEQLYAEGLGPVAHVVPEPPLERYRRTAHRTPAGNLDAARVRPQQFVVELSGWAMDPVRRRRARDVLIAVDGVVATHARVELPRPDIVDAFGRHARDTGWRVDLTSAPLAAGPHVIAAFAVFGDGRDIQAIGEKTVQIGG